MDSGSINRSNPEFSRSLRFRGFPFALRKFKADLAVLAGHTDKSTQATGDAIALLTTLIGQYPDHPEYRNELARVFVFMGHSRVLEGAFADGLAAYRAIAAIAPRLLRAGGHLVVEIGVGQERAVGELFTANGLAIAVVRHDLLGIPRVLAATVR